MGVGTGFVQRPLSIKLFASLCGFSIILSLLLAFYAARTSEFGFTLPPAAAQALTARIMAIRLGGVAFAALLMLLVIFGRSRAARGALGLRWLMGVVTSLAFLRGLGVIAPLGAGGTSAIALSIIQVSIEGFATLLLYGQDAATWFDRRPLYS